jgi:DNA-binding NarL/FixJ family response regulator
MPPPVPVILAFRHPVVAIGVRTVLAAHDDIQIVAECSTIGGTLRAVRKHRPRVLIIGVGIWTGHEAAIEALIQASPDIRVAVFCTQLSHLPEHALLQGASAVLPGDSGPEHVVDCIRAIAAGRRWRAPARLGRSNGAQRPDTDRRAAITTVLSVLSIRERQIAYAVATGKRNREIADAFGISAGTVKLHLNRIYAKLGVNGRLALLRKLVSEANVRV